MPVPRLTEATLAHSPVRRPTYDRSIARTGVVHLGIGAFARAHLATYLDDLLALGHTDVAMLGVSLRSPDVAEALEPQDDLYTLGVVDGNGLDLRVIGSLLGVLHAPTQPAAVRRALAGSDLRMITLTITEKGYCTDPATRRLDLQHPDVRHDLANPERPRSAAGHLVLAANDRRAASAPPITVLSLDNVTSNGRVLRDAVLDLAAATDPSLAAWITTNMHFPCSMVDRMVPATDDTFRTTIANSLGLVDAWPVRAEPFSQWVVERDWADAMPPLADVGVTVVDDVAPWERTKLRVLNALHTAAAHFGLQHDLATVDAVARDAEGRRLLDRLAAEIVEVLEVPSDLDVHEYVRTTFSRFTNSGLGHRCAQIATDTSQKLPPRLLGTLRDRRANGLDSDAIIEVLALWVRSTAGGTVSDPMAATFAGLAARTDGDLVALSTALLSLPAIFGDLAGDSTLLAAVAAHLATVPSPEGTHR